MGIYRVQNNGFAPVGLGVGDQVVTGGGTYLITGVKADGSYDSYNIDRNQTTHNYQGAYDPAPKQGTLTVTEKNAKEVFSQQLGKVVQDRYTPVVTPQTKLETLGFEEAVKMAEKVMEPQYEKRFQESASKAAQRLEKVGLYDTVYGQSLAAEAERDVANELNSAIYSLALQLSQASADQALDILKLAVDDNQHGQEQQAQQSNTALKYLYQMIQDMEKKAAAAAEQNRR